MLRVGAIAGLTIPSFWLGIVMLIVVATLAPSFASLGYVPFSEDPLGNLQRLLLPAIALALPILANLSRLVRTAMLDALGQDYIRTARAKGLGEQKVVLTHALKNALIPILTVLGLTAAVLISGAVVTETVFGLPGVGNLVVSAVLRRDYPVIQGALLVIAGLYVLINFAIDMLYLLVDPRVRY